MGVDVPLEDPPAEAAFAERVAIGVDFDGAIETFMGFLVEHWKPLITPEDH